MNSPESRQIVRTLYRAALCSARRFDRNPAWKAVVASRPTEHYGWCNVIHQRWIPTQVKQPEDSIEKLKQSFLLSVIADLLQNGVFYKPYCHWQSILKKAFRLRSSEYAAFVYSEKLSSSLIDLGFRGLRILHHFENLAQNTFGLSEKYYSATSPGEKKLSYYPHLGVQLTNDIKKGALLASHPQLPGSFSRTLILLYEYDPEVGAKGFCLNGSKVGDFQPTYLMPNSRKSSGEIITDTDDSQADNKVERLRQLPKQSVYWGGPVASNMLFVLHPFSDLEGAVPVGHGISMGGKSASMIEWIVEGKANMEDFLLLAGCASWSSYQLEGELKQHSWFLTDGNGVEKYFNASRNNRFFILHNSEGKEVSQKEPSTEIVSAVGTEHSYKSSLQHYKWKSIMWDLGGEYAHFTHIPYIQNDRAIHFAEDCD
eukprot:jgi/Galph1/946/GphlegSOOS_G5651.1